MDQCHPVKFSHSVTPASWRMAVVAGVGSVLLLAGCGQPPRAAADSGRPRAVETARNSSTSDRGGLEQRRAELLNRIRSADPQQATIQRALINENNELALILSRGTNLDDIPKLVKPMLAEMDKAFPGENHAVVAYAPTEPPRRIGTARFNAQTREMTYTRDNP